MTPHKNGVVTVVRTGRYSSSRMKPLVRIAIRLRAGLAKIDRHLEGTEVFAESLVWIAAWLLIPIYLGRSTVGPGAYAIYAVVAGILVSLGVLATTQESCGGWARFFGHALKCALAILIAGGSVFLLASWWPSATHI